MLKRLAAKEVVAKLEELIEIEVLTFSLGEGTVNDSVVHVMFYKGLVNLSDEITAHINDDYPLMTEDQFERTIDELFNEMTSLSQYIEDTYSECLDRAVNSQINFADII